ncbi:MAG TPA: glycerol kinase GlpK [Paenalcaligenes sp.]|nr:glycerol kinase GlpK [Paenalcaligenes sp.]
MQYLLALDQGTTSSRTLLFDLEGNVIAQAQQEFQQHYPQSGWVEHDAEEIWQSQLATLQQVRAAHADKLPSIAAIGITNQRETTVLWHRETGAPVHPAIVWQDRRSEEICAALRAAGLEEPIRDKTGLRLDPYFSATKLQWIFQQNPDLLRQARAGKLAFGTVDSWLIWRLTHGQVHATDTTNASRTLLFNVHTGQWDDELLAIFNIPHEILPTVKPSVAHFGDAAVQGFPRSLPITGVAGDQQSALFGQACFKPGMAKNTYGTGCFMLMHTGTTLQPSHNGLLSTCAARLSDHRQYALEGSVFVAGAVVQWLRDGLGIIRDSSEIEALALQVPDTGGVVMVPSFTGLGAPYWKADARGTITGLSRGTTAAHIARAALESIAYQSTAVLQAMSRDATRNAGQPLQELRVDGGASANDLLMQFQADLLGIPVIRPKLIETTALGAAYLAGLGGGLYKSTDELSDLWQVGQRFEPQMPRDEAQAHMQRWERAVRQTTTP